MRFSILLHVPLLVPMTGFIPGKERAIIKRTFNFLERIPLQVPAAAFDFNLSKSVPRKRHSDISNNCAYVCRIYIYILSKLSRLEWKRIEIWPQDFNNFLKTIPALLILSNLSNLWRFPACQTGFQTTFGESRDGERTTRSIYVYMRRYRQEIPLGVEEEKTNGEHTTRFLVACLTVYARRMHRWYAVDEIGGRGGSRLPSYHGLPRCAATRICLPTLFTRLGNRVNHPANRICPYSGPVGSIRAETRNE